MPPKNAHTKDIRSFFKPFSIPRDRIPPISAIEDEIVVSSPKKSTSSLSASSNTSLSSTHPRKRGRPRKDSPRSQHKSSTTPKKVRPQRQGADDTELEHFSSSSSEQRKMKAVEIPRLPPPPPPVFEKKARDQSAATSFSSTLSSVPFSSQSASKRIVKNGMLAVTNSDSGSDDTDTSDELADISTFLASKRRKLSPPDEPKDHVMKGASTANPKRRSARVSDEGMSTRSNTPKPTIRRPEPIKVYKNSLASMIKQKEKSEKTQAKIREAELLFEKTRRKREEAAKREDVLVSGLEAVVADDSDEGERMKLAMARTEALMNERKFCFFNGVREAPDSSPFPATPGSVWESYQKDDGLRTAAFLTGFASQLAEEGMVNGEICKWIIRQLTQETRQELCEAYIEVLEVANARNGVAGLGLITLSTFYETLHPGKEGPSPGTSRSPPQSRSPARSSAPFGLWHILDVVCEAGRQNAANCSHLAQVVSELVFANIDQDVAGDFGLQEKVGQTITAILNFVSTESEFTRLCKQIVGEVYGQYRLPTRSYCQAIMTMPALSAQSHRLRRMLAFHLIAGACDEPTAVVQHSDLPAMEETILKRLKTAADFHVSEATDYGLLISLIEVLDVAFDAGFREIPTPTASHTAAKPVGKPTPTAQAAADFNAHVDAYTDQLRSMASRIREGGTSHIQRAEAKSVIERVILRLERCVRTKPRPRKSVFGDGDAVSRLFLNSFLKRAGVEGVGGPDGVS